MDLNAILGGFLGAAAAQLALGWAFQRWAFDFHAWAARLAKHVDFDPPPAPAGAKDRP